MNKSKYILSIIMLFFTFILPGVIYAENVSFGISVGPALGFNSDFNNQKTKSKMHIALSADLLYKIRCTRSSFCEGLYIDASFTWFSPATYSFGSTQVKNTGLTGSFSEKQTAYGASLGIRKEFLNASKLKPFVSIGAGFQYFQVSNTQFKDSLGTPLSLSTKSSSLNMKLTPEIGVRYHISHKLSVEASVKPHMTVPGMLKNSFIEFPVGIKYSF